MNLNNPLKDKFINTLGYRDVIRQGNEVGLFSGVAMGCARRAVHAGPSLWGSRRTLCGEEGPIWNPCTRARL